MTLVEVHEDAVWEGEGTPEVDDAVRVQKVAASKPVGEHQAVRGDHNGLCGTENATYARIEPGESRTSGFPAPRIGSAEPGSSGTAEAVIPRLGGPSDLVERLVVGDPLAGGRQRFPGAAFLARPERSIARQQGGHRSCGCGPLSRKRPILRADVRGGGGHRMTHQVQHTQALPGPAESGRSPPLDGRARRIWENGRVSVELRRLLILDCDGVLVDSERLSIRIHR